MNPTTSNLPESPLTASDSSPRPSPVAIWGARLWLILRVIFLIQLIGIPLTVLPWRPIWEQNSLLAAHPALRQFMNQGFVRGIFTGLGLVNIWMGVLEAVRYRE